MDGKVKVAIADAKIERHRATQIWRGMAVAQAVGAPKGMLQGDCSIGARGSVYTVIWHGKTNFGVA